MKRIWAPIETPGSADHELDMNQVHLAGTISKLFVANHIAGVDSGMTRQEVTAASYSHSIEEQLAVDG
jgi:hypothetical protein